MVYETAWDINLGHAGNHPPWTEDAQNLIDMFHTDTLRIISSLSFVVCGSIQLLESEERTETQTYCRDKQKRKKA